jgi:hypothetical protein
MHDGAERKLQECAVWLGSFSVVPFCCSCGWLFHRFEFGVGFCQWPWWPEGTCVCVLRRSGFYRFGLVAAASWKEQQASGNTPFFEHFLFVCLCLVSVCRSAVRGGVFRLIALESYRLRQPVGRSSLWLCLYAVLCCVLPCTCAYFPLITTHDTRLDSICSCFCFERKLLSAWRMLPEVLEHRNGDCIALTAMLRFLTGVFGSARYCQVKRVAEHFHANSSFQESWTFTETCSLHDCISAVPRQAV